MSKGMLGDTLLTVSILFFCNLKAHIKDIVYDTELFI